MGRSGSKRKDESIWRIGNEKQNLPRKPRKTLPIIWGITKNLLRRNSPSKPSKNRRIIHATGEDSFNCESALDLKSGIAEQGEFLDRRKRFSRSWASEQLWSIARFQQTLEYSELQRYAQARSWIAARYTELLVFHETFLKASVLKKDHPQLSSRIHGIWHHLRADWDQVMQEILWNMEEGWDEIRRVLQYQPHVLIKLLKPWTFCTILEEGTYSQNGVMDDPRYPISELHLGKFPDSMEFQSWKVNFKAEVCANQYFLKSLCSWSKKSR